MMDTHFSKKRPIEDIIDLTQDDEASQPPTKKQYIIIDLTEEDRSPSPPLSPPTNTCTELVRVAAVNEECHILTLPNELLRKILKLVHPSTSLLTGLTCSRLYANHFEINGPVCHLTLTPGKLVIMPDGESFSGFLYLELYKFIRRQGYHLDLWYQVFRPCEKVDTLWTEDEDKVYFAKMRNILEWGVDAKEVEFRRGALQKIGSWSDRSFVNGWTIVHEKYEKYLETVKKGERFWG